MPPPQHAPLLPALSRGERRFWWALFVPVNLVFLPGWFAVERFQPDLNAALMVVVLVKLTYFLTVCWAIHALATVWPRLAGVRSPAVVLAYRLAGVASVGGLLLAHAAGIYGYGAMERQLTGELRASQSTLPLKVGEGMLLEKLQFEKRDVVYEYRFTSLLAMQVDAKKLHDATFLNAKTIGCADRKLIDQLHQGVRLSYVYVDRNYQPIATVVFDRDTCTGQPG